MNGTSIPNISKFAHMCIIFGVSSDWFLSLDSYSFESSEKIDAAILEKTVLDRDTVNAIRNLDEDSIRFLKLFLKSIKRNKGGD